MQAVINPAKYLAADVLFYALVDLIRQPTMSAINSPDYDNAGTFFASGDHVPWCRMADVDPDALLAHAVDLAIRYKAWTEHPTVFPRPRVHIPMDDWRTHTRMTENEREI